MIKVQIWAGDEHGAMIGTDDWHETSNVRALLEDAAREIREQYEDADWTGWTVQATDGETTVHDEIAM